MWVQIRSAAHLSLSRRVATESLVLLENKNNTLPLSAATKRKIATGGPRHRRVQHALQVCAHSIIGFIVASASVPPPALCHCAKDPWLCAREYTKRQALPVYHSCTA